MGLLDDAIREHLDLKRRCGSDPAEVARLEQEALGPVRREPEPDGEDADRLHEEHAPEHEHAAEGEGHEHEAHEAPEDPRHSDVVHQPTTEFRVEDHHDDEDDEPAPQADEPAHEEDEDVLEETPEFLQETPEHDRLWFEQRPPRDFDFDG